MGVEGGRVRFCQEETGGETVVVDGGVEGSHGKGGRRGGKCVEGLVMFVWTCMTRLSCEGSSR